MLCCLELHNCCNESHKASLKFNIFQNNTNILPNLEILSLSGTKFIPEELASLAALRLPKLEKLNLNNCGIGNMFNELVGMNFDLVWYLNLSDNNLDDSALKQMINIFVPKLAVLYLSNNSFTVKGIDYLLECNLMSLEMLGLNNTKLDDDCASSLSRFGFFNLKTLDIRNNSITQYGIDMLKNWPIQHRSATP